MKEKGKRVGGRGRRKGEGGGEGPHLHCMQVGESHSVHRCPGGEFHNTKNSQQLLHSSMCVQLTAIYLHPNKCPDVWVI